MGMIMNSDADDATTGYEEPEIIVSLRCRTCSRLIEFAGPGDAKVIDVEQIRRDHGRSCIGEIELLGDARQFVAIGAAVEPTRRHVRQWGRVVLFRPDLVTHAVDAGPRRRVVLSFGWTR